MSTEKKKKHRAGWNFLSRRKRRKYRRWRKTEIARAGIEPTAAAPNLASPTAQVLVAQTTQPVQKNRLRDELLSYVWTDTVEWGLGGGKKKRSSLSLFLSFFNVKIFCRIFSWWLKSHFLNTRWRSIENLHSFFPFNRNELLCLSDDGFNARKLRVPNYNRTYCLIMITQHCFLSIIASLCPAQQHLFSFNSQSNWPCPVLKYGARFVLV